MRGERHPADLGRWRGGGQWLACRSPARFPPNRWRHQGWDSLTVDMQHGVVDYQAAANMLAAISTTDVTPLVRGAVARPGYHHEDAGCRRLWRDLPDGQQRVGRRDAGVGLPLSAGRQPQLRADPGAALWRRGLPETRQRNGDRLRHDRDGGGAGPSGRHPLRRRGWTRSMSGPPICPWLWAARRNSTRRKSPWSRRSR